MPPTKSVAYWRTGTKVFDSWWPWRLGVVTKQMKTRIKVCWSDGEQWTYDQAHLRFLRA